MRHWIPLLLLLTVSCGSLQRMAVRSASPMMVESANKLTTERSWEFFKDSTPANLKMMETLYWQDKDNLQILGVLIKGYAGYAFAVPETLSLGEVLAGNDDSPHKGEAIGLYTRALDYGISYLSKLDISRDDLLTLEESKLKEKLDKKLDHEDLAPLLFTAQAWGSLMNLQKENIALISLVPRVKILFDWVCGKDKNIEHGVCDIFYAQYEASRPRMLGGNPELARKLYEQAIQKRPHHLLIRIGLIEQLLIPAFDGEAYEAQAKILKEEIAKWEEENRDSLENKSVYRSSEHLNLFNAIAKKRFEFIEKQKKKIFEG